MLRAQLLFLSSLHLAHGENVAFGATVKVETLNRIADLLAPGMLNVTPPKSALDLVDAAAYLTRNLRQQLSLCAHDFDPPVKDAAVQSDAGLATIFDSSFGGVPLKKFFQAQCIVGGAGLPLSRQHAHNRELAFLDHDTFVRLPSASFRASALCAVGEVVSWGGHFVNWSALAAAFTAEHRMPIDDRHKRVLLSVQSSDKAFSSFAPDGASVQW